eukprot:g19780.t1
MLNVYFASVFTVEKDMEDIECGEINRNMLKNGHIGEEEVLNILKHIKVDKSLGPNQVYTRTMWETRDVNAGPLADIFVSSIATEVPKRIDEGRAVDMTYMDFIVDWLA